jgi:hypothetical protein
MCTPNESCLAAKPYLSALVQAVLETEEEFRAMRRALSKRFFDREMVLRVEISDQFHAIQARHLSELMAHEKEFLLRFARDRARHLSKQAKSDLEQRKVDVTNEYLVSRAEILGRQKGEMRELSDNLDWQLTRLGEENVAEIERLWAEFYPGRSPRRLSFADRFRRLVVDVRETIENPEIREAIVCACERRFRIFMENAEALKA